MYLEKYGKLLGEQAAAATRPLHTPGKDAVLEMTLLRKPFEPQAHCIAAGVKALRRQRAILVCGEMGTGKTLMGQLIAHGHAGGKPYRGIILCPGHLVPKWQREITETIPDAKTYRIEHVRDLVKLPRGKKPTGVEWFVISKDRAKLEPKWRAAFVMRRGEEVPRCPRCGKELLRENKGKDKDECPGLPIMPGDMAKKRLDCPTCKEPLWTFTREPWRWAPATYIHRRMKGFFNYLVLDEVHELKGAADVAQANAAGSLAASADKVIALTGTLTGGKVEDLRPLLFRLCPVSLIREGYSWSEATSFAEKYGLIETRISSHSGGSENRQSKGRASRSTTRIVKPGIMPALFGRHLVDKTIFLGLKEMAENLPEFNERIQPAYLDDAQQAAYGKISGALQAAVRDLIRQCGPGGAMKILGPMLNCLMAWPDYPFDWSLVGYTDREGAFHPVVKPANLDRKIIRPKERLLLDTIHSERAEGRQVWVFCEYTDKIPVLKRLAELSAAEGLKTETLFSSVDQSKREDWIAKHGKNADVVFSHPGLVKTGLDLFDKRGNHNFSTLIFYETGWSAFTMRQAARRSWRIGQTLLCKVLYLYYSGTAQEHCLELIGRKIAASEALEGKFTSEGMAAMAGEDSSVQMALAKNLADNIGTTNASRSWQKVGAVSESTVAINWLDDFAGQPDLLSLIGG